MREEWKEKRRGWNTCEKIEDDEGKPTWRGLHGFELGRRVNGQGWVEEGLEWRSGGHKMVVEEMKKGLRLGPYYKLLSRVSVVASLVTFTALVVLNWAAVFVWVPSRHPLELPKEGYATALGPVTTVLGNPSQWSKRSGWVLRHLELSSTALGTTKNCVMGFYLGFGGAIWLGYK